MPFTLDRFEDNGLAVLETDDGDPVVVPRAQVPPEAREGSAGRLSRRLVRLTCEVGLCGAVPFGLEVGLVTEVVVEGGDAFCATNAADIVRRYRDKSPLVGTV